MVLISEGAPWGGGHFFGPKIWGCILVVIFPMKSGGHSLYIFFSIDAISLKMFLVRQKYIYFEKQNCFWWETKNDKKIWIWKVENPKSWYLTILGDFQFFKFNFFCHFWFPIKKIFFSQSKHVHTFVLPKMFLGW